MGPLLERVPGQRGPPLPRRREPPRVRHPRVRLHPRPGDPRQGRRAHPRAAAGLRRGPPAGGGHPGRHLPVQEQHRLGGQLLRLPRELPDVPARRLQPLRRGADPVLRVPPDLRGGRQGAADGPGRHVLHRPAGRAHLGGRLLGHHPQPAHHQHPRRAPRRRRALPAPARHRGRLQHERVRHLPQGGGHLDPAAHAGGPLVRPAGHDAGEPHPGHPRDQPRPHLQAHRAPGQRARGLGARHPGRVPRAGQALRRDQGPVPAGGEGAGHVGVLPQRAGVATPSSSTASATG